MYQIGPNQFVLLNGEVVIYVHDKIIVVSTEDIRVIQDGQETVVFPSE